MKFNTTTLALLAGSFISLVTAPAQAFTTFSFTTDFSPKPADPQKNITLESVTFDGNTYVQSQLALVRSANIIENNLVLSNLAQSGPGSSDCGDLVGCTPVALPTDQDVVDALGNYNLNHIIDTEDNQARSNIEVFFNKRVDTLFFFERGMNSDLWVELIYADGSRGPLTEIKYNEWSEAGFSINTTEIDRAQKVGSRGVAADRLVKGARLVSARGDGGPDFKVFGTRVSTPEPATAIGLGAVALGAIVARRRKSADA